jgi:hypothetical protein
MSDDTSLTARLRDAVARLAPSQDGDVSPQARDEEPIAISREEHTAEPDRDDIERWVREYYQNPLIRQPIRKFAADVVEPGVRISVDAGDEEEPTVPSDYRFAEFRGMPLSDALREWLGQAAIVGGRFGRDITDLLEDVVIDVRGRRGTALVEHAYDDPREREYILGLRAFKVESTTAYTRDGKNILLRPGDTDVDFETVAVQDISGDPTRFDQAPTTPAGQAAAFVQFDDIFGSYDEKDDVPLALDDVTLLSNDPDTGTIFGEPDAASVVDRSEELREMFEDTAQAIKAVGYGHWIAQVETDDEDEARALLNSFDPSDPERVNVTNYGVEAERFDGQTPDTVEQIQQQIEYILTSLPTPLYRVGFAGDINRDISDVQQDDYREAVSRERDRLESAFHELLHEKAREFMLGDAKADESLDVDVSLVIEPEESESPLQDENFSADEFSNVMSGLKQAAPGGAVEQLVPPHEIRETFLGIDPEPPEAPDGDPDAMMSLPDEADERVQEAFRDAYLEGNNSFSDVPVIPTGLEELSDAWLVRWAEWVAAGRPEIPESERLAEIAALDWNPELHPRDPRTGKFVERPFGLPDDVPDFGSQSRRETLAFLDDNGADLSDIFDPDSPVTVDGIPNDATGLEDVPDGDDGDGRRAEGDGGAASETVETADVGEPLSVDDVSRGDTVTVRDPSRGTFTGDVADIIQRDDGSQLVEVDRGDGSTFVGPNGERVMFPEGTDIPATDIIQGDLEDGDVITIDQPGGESVTGFYTGRSGGTLFVDTTATPGTDGRVEVPAGQLASPEASVTRYDTDDLLDVPGIDPLPPEEGGLNGIPETEDGDELAAAIREFDTWSEASGRDFSEPIDDSQLQNAKDVTAGILDRAVDTELSREYAKRALIGNNADRANNGAMQTPRGQKMLSMTLEDGARAESPRVIKHEMGHGVVQLRGYGSDNNMNARRGNYWPDDIDPTDSEDFQQYLLDRGDDSETAHGWDEWSDDVAAEFDDADEFDTDVGNAIGEDLSAGDVVRFTDSPEARLDSTTWEVYDVRGGSDRIGDRREVYLRDRDGNTISREVTEEEDYGVRNGDAEAGELRYTGAADVQAVAKGYSDIEATPGRPPESRFTQDGAGTTVDEYRETLDADSWEDRTDAFASEVNRAFYKMQLKYHREDTEAPIIDGYSSTTADEVPSQMHELFQTDSSGKAGQAREVADTYPRLTASYLELFDPSAPVAEQLADVDGVSV